ITARELEVAKGHLRADMLLSLEDSGARMSRIGSSLLLLGKVMSVDEILSKIDAVTLDAVRAAASKVLGGERVLAVVGPYEEADFSR
ncbi:MAG: insulinase family protein, partial [Acidimicrobiales bacterium]